MKKIRTRFFLIHISAAILTKASFSSSERFSESRYKGYL